MISKLLTTFAITCFATCVTAQITQSSLFVINPYPVYKLSPDGKTLGVTEVSEDQQKSWMNYINLTTFKYEPKGSVSTKDYTITPGLRSAFANAFSTKGFKGNDNWIPYKKYMSWYFPSSTDWANRVQWADRDWVIAGRTDGLLLTAGKLDIKDGRDGIKVMIHDFNLVDPNTGQVKSTIRKGKIMELPYDWWTFRSKGWLANNDSLLLWSWISEQVFSMKVHDGLPLNIKLPCPPSFYIGKYAVCLKQTGFDKDKKAFRKVIVDLESGKTVYDQTFDTKNSSAYWIAFGEGNRLYTLNRSTSVLLQEEWTGSELKLIDSTKLQIDSLLNTRFDEIAYDYNYTMMVSQPLKRLLLLPKRWNENYNLSTDLFVWDISDGKFVHRNTNFVKPSQTFLADHNRINQIRIPEKITLAENMIIRKRKEGALYLVMKKEPGSSLWKVVRTSFDKQINAYSFSETTALEYDLTFEAEVIQPVNCNECNGSGELVTVSQRTTEKVDKMIYNKITTTRTFTERKTQVCKVCKGLGFSVKN
jgi:hypothetical protein